MEQTEGLSVLAAAAQGDREAQERVLSENSGLIWSIVRRFYGRGVDPDDLYQLACIGFIKAVRGFDFTYGTQFSTYAVPKISGEIRRFLRDDGAVKVGRTVKERAQMIFHIRERLTLTLGREPVLSELAAESGLCAEEIAETELALREPESLQQELGDGLTLDSAIGSENGEDTLIETIALRQCISLLPKKERETIILRYYRGLTQDQTARILKVSQVQVSRLERRALARLHSALEEQ